MKTKNTNLFSTQVLFFIGTSILTLTACTKEMIVPKSDQIQLQAGIGALAKAPESFTSNEQINTDFSVFIPCANAGAGEFVLLTGTLHVLTAFTINGNNVRGKSHFQPQGISGIGLTTGDKFQATGVTQNEFKGSLVNGQFERTEINNFRIIGVGKDNNFLIHQSSHVTINENGALTTVIDNLVTDCK